TLAALWLTLKLDVAFLRDRRLFDGDHLALHVRKFSRGLFVSANKEGGRPKHNDSRGGRELIFGSLAILRAGESRGPLRNPLSLKRELLAIVGLIHHRRYIGRPNFR